VSSSEGAGARTGSAPMPRQSLDARSTVGDDMNELLEAGAVLPLGTEDAAGGGGGTTETAQGPARADVLTARAYTHPALDDRTVVRLAPEAIGPAEDLALEYLGFASGEAAQVGLVKPQSLSFPAWALVHDPANGHHALAVVKEMERLTRLVRSRPGHAKEGFDEIGSRLDRSVPHFLPTFYEQVGRLFLAAESVQMASTFFGKARTAEQRHGLEVDEARLREVFVEFAAAGALSVKAVRDHARALSERLGPDRAYQEFRLLASLRSSAGLAPYAGLLEDLRRLARKAGADVAAEECGLLAEILDSGSVRHAPAGFWKSALPGLTRLASADSSVRAKLLGLLPSAGGDGRESFDESWLELLESCGAVELLLDGTVQPAGWLSAWTSHRDRGWRNRRRLAAELTLVERLAARLVADGVPVRLQHPHLRANTDLDLLDLCLSLGVPVVTFEQTRLLDLGTWLDDDAPGRRNLAALAADPRFTRVLRAGVEDQAERAGNRLELILRHPALEQAVAGWLNDRADDLAGRLGLPGLGRLLSRVGHFAAPRVLATAPDALARMADFSPAPALADTLRRGVFDELGWPALEEALQELGDGDPKDRTHWRNRRDDGWYRMTDAWPALVVRLRLQAVVVGPEGILDRHTVSLPAPGSQWAVPEVRYIGGQFLVMNGHGEERRARWSGRAADVFTPVGDLHEPSAAHATASLELADGSRTFGARPVHAGDREFEAMRRAVASDGVSLWVHHDGSWWDYDPVTARRGRVSVPSFFESPAPGAAPGGPLVSHHCTLLPLRPGLENSPFGSRDGLLGWWVRADREPGTVMACSVDGTVSRKVVAAAGHRGILRYEEGIPLPPMRLPAGGVLHPRVDNWRNGTVSFFDDEGLELGSVELGASGGTYAQGTDLVPTLAHWHALRPRDEAGSAVLRRMTDAGAQALVDAVLAGAAPADAVRRLLPGVTHPRLTAGVAGLVAQAAHCAQRINEVMEKFRQKPGPAPVRVEHAHDAALRQGFSGLTDTGRGGATSREQESVTVAAQLDAVRRVLDPSAGEAPATWASSPLNWPSLAGPGLAAVAVRAAGAATGEETRLALLEFLELALAVEADGRAVLADPRGLLRVVLLKPQEKRDESSRVMRSGDRRIAVLGHVYDGSPLYQWECLEYDPAGKFGAWDGFTEVSARVLGSPDDAPLADGVRALVGEIRARGPLPFRPEQASGFAETVGVNPAVAAMLQLGTAGELPAALLAPLGLKSVDAKAAVSAVGALGTEARRRWGALLLPADSARTAELWSKGPDLEPLTEGWLAEYGKRRVAPSWLVAHAARERPGSPMLDHGLNPGSWPALTGRTVQQLNNRGQLVPEEAEKLLGAGDLTGCLALVRWLAYRLPYGDPLRRALPELLGLLRERLADPKLLLLLNSYWCAKNDPEAVDRQRRSIGLPALADAPDEGRVVEVSPALVAVTDDSSWYHRIEVWARPSALIPVLSSGSDHADLRLLRVAAGDSKVLRALEDVFGPGADALTATDEAPGAQQHPANSAPEQVKAAMERFGLSDDAAALYLMLLALPDPSDRNQAEWTGWKPARLKRARAELTATDLVVEAKRARAGRSLFLPGSWLEARTPRLPVEGWKQPLLPWSGSSGFVVPDRPVGELFRAAWERIAGGDTPAFEEFETRGTKGGSRGRR
jgi:hypothetical protein